LTASVRAAVIALSALFVTTLPGSAFAQDGVRITIEAGYDNRYTGTQWVPVSVTVESPRAIEGDLEVSSEQVDGSASSHSLAIEVPGGGKKRFDLLVPAPAQDRQVAARIVVGDEVVGTASAAPLLLRGGALVGVLADSIPSGIEGIQAEPAQIEMVPALLAPEQLDLGAAALGALSYVVADADDIEALSDAQRDALVDWTTAGGRVLIAAERPAAAPDLGPATELRWNPAGTEVAEADRTLADGAIGVADGGLGEVMVTPGNLVDVTRAVYEAALRAPPLIASVGNEGPFNDFGASPEDELVRAGRGGEDLRLGWFVGFLVVYLVLVGPVNYFLLRRRGRKELLWVTIPVLAMAFSGVAYGLARGSRGDLVAKTAGIVWADRYGQRGLSVATVSSGTGGTRTFTFPTKVAMAPTFTSIGGSTQEGTTRITSDGAEVAIDTSPFSVHAAGGAIDDFEGFIDARVERTSGGELRYELTNRTPYQLRDIVLIEGTAAADAGDLEPGATTSETFVRDPQFRFGRSQIGGGLRRALDGRLRSLLGAGFFATPYVVASVEDHDLGITLEGNDLGTADRSMVASPVQMDADAGAANTIDLVATDGDVRAYNPGALTLEGFQEAVFAYRAPAGIDPERITAGELRFFANGPRQELERYDWRAERWVAMAAARNNRLILSVPPESFSQTGEAYFRLSPNRHGFAEIYRFEVEAEVS
jgi:hypothetical protein